MKRINVKIKDDEALKRLQKNVGYPISPYTKEYNLNTKIETRYRKPKIFENKNTYFSDRIFDEMRCNIHPYMYFDYYDYKYEITLIGKKEDLERVLEQKLGNLSYCFYPYKPKDVINKVIYNPNVKHKYPIFIVSKGRWDISLTALNFLRRGITDFRIIVEPQEYEMYNKFFEEENLLILDMKYKEEYETLDEYGTSKGVGPGAARNFAWDIARKEGHKFHWVFDDNIRTFHGLYNFDETRVIDQTLLYYTERIAESYDNIYQAGLNYYSFLPRRKANKPYILNSRVYSMILLRTDIPYRWRGRYNEDTILSLDILKDGHATFQCNVFSGHKEDTQKIVGGNTDEFYKNEGTLPKSMMLYKTYPEYAKLKYKIRRWHHNVNYEPFKNNPIGNFVGKPFDEDEIYKFYTLKDDEIQYRNNIIDFYEKVLGIEVENKEEILRKLERYENALQKYKRETIISKPENKKYVSEYIIKKPTKYGLVINETREFDKKEFDKYKDKLDKKLKEYGVDTLYNIIGKYVWEDIAHFCYDYGYNMIDILDEKELENSPLDFTFVIKNSIIPKIVTERNIPKIKVELKSLW